MVTSLFLCVFPQRTRVQVVTGRPSPTRRSWGVVLLLQPVSLSTGWVNSRRRNSLVSFQWRCQVGSFSALFFLNIFPKYILFIFFSFCFSSVTWSHPLQHKNADYTSDKIKTSQGKKKSEEKLKDSLCQAETCDLLFTPRCDESVYSNNETAQTLMWQPPGTVNCECAKMCLQTVVSLEWTLDVWLT